MASTRTPPDGDAVPLAGTREVAAGLRARRRPILASLGPRPALPGIGDVGRAARRFSSLTFLSLSARRAAVAHRADPTGSLPVRPADYWWGNHEDDAAAPSTGDAALDRLVARRAHRGPGGSPEPARRGLPSTVHRRSHSIAGPLTAPGGVARRLLPAPVVPVPNPANSSQAAARAPRSRPAPGARTGAGDTTRPAAPATVNRRSHGRPLVAAPAPVVAAAADTRAAATPANATIDAGTATMNDAVIDTAVGTVGRPAMTSRSGEPSPRVDVTDDPARARVDGFPVVWRQGRPVAVQPLPSGWRAPTVWHRATPGADVRRIISDPTWPAPAAGTVRLLPIGGVVVPVGPLATTPASSVPSSPGAPGATPTSPLERAPGFRPADVRRPGAWLARPGGAPSPGTRSAIARPVPLGPLGPVRWSADRAAAGTAGSVAGTPAWAASVAAASAEMATTTSRSVVRPPAAGGFTLVRGGRADRAASTGGHRPAVHPATNVLRLVPPAPGALPSSAVGARRSDATTSAHAASAEMAAGSAAAAVGRAVRPGPGAAPFAAIPGALGTHGLPAARSSIVGATTRSTVTGPDVPAGALARLVHGHPPALPSLVPAPPALVPAPAGGDAAAFATASPAPPSRPGLPSTPASVARRTSAAVAAATGVAGFAGHAGGFRPGATDDSSSAGRYAAVPSVGASSGHGVASPSGSWTVRAIGRAPRGSAISRTASPAGATVASLRRLPVAPGAFPFPSAADPAGAPAATPAVRHRSRAPHGVAAVVSGHRFPGAASSAATPRAGDVPSRALPGSAPAGLRPLPSPSASPVPSPAPVSTTAAPVRPLRPSAPAAAARFDEVLRAAGEPVRPVALPVRFRPLAERIVGRMPVSIATGTPSRRALAAVGARAATTGSVIHLPAAPDASARSASILAHELTHVAAASPVARFHGGRPSVEESAAVDVERIVARAARTAGRGRGPAVMGTADLPVAGFVGRLGSTAGPAVPASAASPVAHAGGGAASTVRRTPSATPTSAGHDMTRRSPTVGGSGGRAAGAADRQVIRRLVDGSVGQTPPSDPAPADSDERAQATVLSEAVMDAIVHALEARLLASIERRGGMWRGGF